MGFIGLMMYAQAPVLGPLIGGRLFRRALLGDDVATSILPIGDLVAAGVFIFFLHLPQTPPVVSLAKKKPVLQLDPVGIALAMAAIICFILGLRYGGTSHLWNSSQVHRFAYRV